MAEIKEIKDPVNWAIEEMRHANPRTFRIQQFVKATGISIDQLQYHDKNPDAKWTRKEQRIKMSAFFKEHFNGRIVADHVNCKMVKVAYCVDELCVCGNKLCLDTTCPDYKTGG